MYHFVSLDHEEGDEAGVDNAQHEGHHAEIPECLNKTIVQLCRLSIL